MNIPVEKVLKIGDILNDVSRPLKERFRALFTLRNVGGDLAIKLINDCFKDSSALLKHELAYCLGQMQDERAIPILENVLKDVNENSMVRHEAAEALGAIGCKNSIEILKKFSTDSAQEVAETCQLAIQRISALSNVENGKSLYMSVDPAPPSDCQDVSKLKTILLNNNEDLFERYKAMFSLRDLRSSESTLVLCEGLFNGSSLFRHEIAFVLGQLQMAEAVPALIKCLSDCKQHEMVRHECAEALGAIATDECMHILNQYLQDDSRVVRESCVVALDMADYESSSEFQYANTVTTACA